MDVSKKSTFGRGLARHIANALPYRSPQGMVADIQMFNPKFKDFYTAGGSVRDELLAQHSITAKPMVEGGIQAGGFFADVAYSKLMYAQIDENKYRRIRDYRVMAAYAEVSNALDEICDEFINPDDDGEIVKLDFKDRILNIDKIIKDKIEEEFYKFINIYDLSKKGWELARRLLVDGEIFFEHIIHKKHTEEGILGIIDIPTESIEPVYDSYQNMMVQAFLLRKNKDDLPANTESNRNQGHIQSVNPNEKIQIPMDKNQVTYIHSGTWDESKTIRVPFIERARRAYRQLSLIEDAIIIYRLARAPERYVFNVDCGEMSTPQSESYINKLMQRFWSKQTFDLDDQQRVKAFNPQSILDAFWFPRRAGSEGTSVTTLQGGQNLGQLEDLHYFVKKLYEALKVPVNRLDPESSYSPDATVLREELRFANFIVRLQCQFAQGLKSAFITHLKMKEDMWKKSGLKENLFDITLNPPRNYYELRQQQILDLRFNNFNAIAGNPSISDGYAQMKYLGWSEKEIKLNRAWQLKDAKHRRAIAQAEGAEMAGGEGLGTALGGASLGGGGGEEFGSENPPEFGPLNGLEAELGASDEAPPAEETPPPAQ